VNATAGQDPFITNTTTLLHGMLKIIGAENEYRT